MIPTQAGAADSATIHLELRQWWNHATFRQHTKYIIKWWLGWLEVIPSTWTQIKPLLAAFGNTPMVTSLLLLAWEGDEHLQYLVLRNEQASTNHHIYELYPLRSPHHPILFIVETPHDDRLSDYQTINRPLGFPLLKNHPPLPRCVQPKSRWCRWKESRKEASSTALPAQCQQNPQNFWKDRVKYMQHIRKYLYVIL